MAEISIPSASRSSRVALRLAAAGILDEPLPAVACTSGVGLTSQTVYGLLCGLAAGDIVAGVVSRISVAAAGTAPTLTKFGLANSSGVMLAVTADVGAASGWALGAQKFAFTAPYTVPADGGYFVVMLMNGSWGSTQVQVGNQTNAPTSGVGAVPGATTISFSWTGQTDLPAVGNSLTLTSSGALRYMAPYGTAIS